MLIRPSPIFLWGVNVNPKEESKHRCPRCGAEYSYIKSRKRGDRVYLYAVHYLGYERAGGRVRKHARECYLGPAIYKYVSGLHEREGLLLRGLVDSSRALEYIETLLEYIVNMDMDRDTAQAIISMLREALRILEEKHS